MAVLFSNKSRKKKNHGLLPPIKFILLLSFIFYQALQLKLTHFGLDEDQNESSVMTSTRNTGSAHIMDSSRLGDGCYHVFLDVGANLGNHGRFLYEPEKFPESKGARPLFDSLYGTNRDNRNFCIFAFEANPYHWPHLQNISKAYASMGWRYHVVEAAVADYEGTATFFHERDKDSPHKLEVQFSGSKFQSGTKEGRIKWEEEVPTIRLSEWINYHIHERKIPNLPPAYTTNKSTSSTSTSSTNISNDHNDHHRPILSMKVDIESFEYIVLPDLIHFNAICGFDLVIGEFHKKWAPFEFEPMEGLQKNTKLESEEEAVNLQKSLIQVMHASRQCSVEFKTLDDESYMAKGGNIPLPTP